MKKIVSLALVAIALFVSTVPAYAGIADAAATEPNPILTENVTERAEVTQWYFRMNNGVLEMRLWSVTYGFWKTDWMPAPV